MNAMDTRRLLKPLHKVRSFLEELPPAPTPEEVQKFRTQLRRMEAVLDACALSSSQDGRRLLRHERPLRVRAGKIHDMDRGIGLAESLAAKGAEQCRTELLELIGAQRHRHTRKFRAAAQKAKRKVCKSLDQCESKICVRLGAKASTEDKLVAAAKLAALIIEAGSRLAHYPRLSRKNLHLFRIRIRHFQRLLKIADQQRTPLYAALTEAKIAIGEWHDWHRLWKTARQLQGHPGHRALMAEIRKIREGELRRAMHTSRELRARYLKSLPSKSRGASPHKVAGQLAA